MCVGRIVRGAVIGAAAGLIASWVMEQAQSLLQADGQGGGESSTEQAADRVSVAATGEPVAEANRARAGQAVHYGFGAALGLGYGVLAAISTRVTTGFGAVFGLGVALAVDDALVPALGLGPPPSKTPPSTHAYSLISHLIFGLSLEASRRGLNKVL